jgi:hypothetical protein
MRNAQDNAKLAADLRELAAAGCTVDCSVAEGPKQKVGVEIYLVGGIYDSMIFELPDRRTGYILDVEIVNQTSKVIYCSETELRMQWEDTMFGWLPDPKETKRTFSYFRRKRNGSKERVEVANESYCFFGGTHLEYDRDLVLNHVLLKGCSLQPGCPLAGLLLATGGPMPHDLRHGQWLEPTLVLTASNHREYSAQIQLWTDRMESDRKVATRALSVSPDPLGVEVSSGVVVGTQNDATRPERRSSVGRDRDVDSRISL